jgi:hypothetical protein
MEQLREWLFNFIIESQVKTMFTNRRRINRKGTPRVLLFSFHMLLLFNQLTCKILIR